MLFWKEGKLNLSPYKVNYTQHGKQEAAYTDDKKWWEDFAKKWEHTTIQSFEDMEYTPEELQRYEEIKYMPEGHADICAEYVKTGQFPNEPNHPLEGLEVKELLADLIEMQMMGGILRW